MPSSSYGSQIPNCSGHLYIYRKAWNALLYFMEIKLKIWAWAIKAIVFPWLILLCMIFRVKRTRGLCHMGLSIVRGWATEFTRPNKCERAEFWENTHMDTTIEDKRERVAASENPGASSFTTRASGQQSSLCCAAKTGPWTLASVLSSLLLVHVRILDGRHPVPIGVVQWTVDLLTIFKSLLSYSILISYYNSPWYVDSIKEITSLFGYFSYLLFNSMRSAEITAQINIRKVNSETLPPSVEASTPSTRQLAVSPRCKILD